MKRKNTDRTEHSALDGIFDGLDAYALNPLAAKPVLSTDVLLGAAVGALGGGVVAKGVNKFLAGKLPAVVANNMGYLVGPLAGLAAYFALRRSNQGKATGIFFGALAASVAQVAADKVAPMIPGLSDLIEVQMNGMVVPDLNGVPVQDLNDFAGMAALSMAEDEDDGLADLIEVRY
jgi:hypothetical protein